MQEQLISFETAKLAKEKGFDIITNKYYKSINPLVTKKDLKINLLDNELKTNYNFRSYAGLYLAPTQSLLQKWLREEHGIHIELYRHNPNNKLTWYASLYDLTEESHIYGFKASFYWTNVDGKAVRHESYEEALEKGLQEALKLI